MRRFALSAWRNQSGATAVEFALVIGPFVLLLFGGIEFGRAFWAREALQDVATVVARCAAIPQPACASSSAYDAKKTLAMVLDLAAHNGLRLDPVDVSITRSTMCSGLTGFTKASLSYEFNTAVRPLLDAFLDSIEFKAEACYPNE